MTTASRLSRLSLNQKLAVAAFALGLVALFAQPNRGSSLTVNAKDLTSEIGSEADHVTVSELAGWIVAGRSDYRLLDLRSAAAFASYHIPTAESVPLATLPESSLLANERIVLYSEGGIHAYQAWMLLRAKGWKGVYTLKGGLDEWKDSVLFPTLAENAPPQEKARFERTASLARFFGGTPRIGGAATAASAIAMPTPEMPKVEAPAAAVGGAAKPRKKKEGC